MTNSIENKKKYFDLLWKGVGYVYQVHKVPVKRGKAFWSCNISALQGPVDDPVYISFDCRVSGSEAIKVIESLDKACKENKKIMIGFKLGGLDWKTFFYKKGDKKGEVGVNLNSHLLYIGWAKVDGEIVYKAPSKNTQEDKASIPSSVGEKPIDGQSAVSTADNAVGETV